MDDKQILKNAPAGATHYGNDGDYICSSVDGLFYMNQEGDCFDFEELYDVPPMRSLKDIRRIVELEKTIANVERIAKSFPQDKAIMKVINEVTHEKG